MCVRGENAVLEALRVKEQIASHLLSDSLADISWREIIQLGIFDSFSVLYSSMILDACSLQAFMWLCQTNKGTQIIATYVLVNLNLGYRCHITSVCKLLSLFNT